MARKKKTETETPETDTEAVRPSEVRKIPSARALRSLLKEGRKMQSDVAELRGEHGASIKNAVENQNLHKGAFAILKRLDKLEAEKAADLWDHLRAYMDVVGLDTRIKSAMRLDLDGASSGEENDEVESDQKITQFPQATA